MGVRLSEDEAWGLVGGSLTGIVTTLRRDGFPVSLPLWFVVLDREVYFRTRAASKKVARVRNDPRAGFLVESGERWAELAAVSFTATASVVEDGELVSRVLAGLGQKYAGRGPGRPDALPEATVRHYAAEEAIVRLTPVGAPITWNNAKIRRAP